ncbi:MAG: 30S ribosomal protein S17 [Candidatus Babeliales bacterium]
MTNEKKKKIHIGKVVSDKMDKTIVVETERIFRHPRFHKILKKVKKYKVHDEEGKTKIGDIVEFYEGRPISKTKYMYFSRVVK